MRNKVLIVEDEIFVALDLEDMVEAAGFEVVAIAADKAAAMAAAERADIALVDLNLRDGPTGSEIGRTLAREHDIRVIYVTANPSQVGPGADIALGVIRKPFAVETVRAAVEIAARDPLALNDNIEGFMPFSALRDASRQAGSQA